MSKSQFWTGTDAVGRSVTLRGRPERIVSLVPSQTELVVDLGVKERLVGRTRYCIHPASKMSSIVEIGGTKRIDLEKIVALKPDFFLAEKEETPKEMVEALSAIAPVYVTNVVSIETAISMCRDVGALVGRAREGERLGNEIEVVMNEARDCARGIISQPERVLYLIWRKPWMAAASDTFIDSCLSHIGFINAAAELKESLGSSLRYPELDETMIKALKLDRVFLSSEPYPFREKHFQEVQDILPDVRIQIVDGELFSWYGTRMLKMPGYWKTL